MSSSSTNCTVYWVSKSYLSIEVSFEGTIQVWRSCRRGVERRKGNKRCILEEGGKSGPTEKEGNHYLGSNPIREQLAPTVGPREFEEGRDHMVSTRSMVNEKMSEDEQIALMMSLQRDGWDEEEEEERGGNLGPPKKEWRKNWLGRVPLVTQVTPWGDP